MGSHSSSSSSSSRSSRSAYSSNSSRRIGGGGNVDICIEKEDKIIKVYKYKKEGFIFETEKYYYAIKYDKVNKSCKSKRSTDYKECKDFILPLENENIYYEESKFYSGLELGDVEKIVYKCLNTNKYPDFIETLSEKINNYENLQNISNFFKICEDRDKCIQSVRKIVVPYKGRAGVQTGRVFASIFTLGLINISEDLRQDLEHHGLIFETEDFYYAIHYTDGGILTKRSKQYEECKNFIFEAAPNPYDDKTTWTYNCSFRSYLTIGDVESKVRSLIPYFNEDNYHGLKNNCQYFVKDLLDKID